MHEWLHQRKKIVKHMDGCHLPFCHVSYLFLKKIENKEKYLEGILVVSGHQKTTASSAFQACMQ
ncbi:hypothetical protein Sjap_025497 [Stephania japonica]|uniref:Uncharacterized protein n=1 Tax=Stephania japonica TaxID=461633 RepID=A0AAP0E1X7_9MAGN